MEAIIQNPALPPPRRFHAIMIILDFPQQPLERPNIIHKPIHQAILVRPPKRNTIRFKIPQIIFTRFYHIIPPILPEVFRTTKYTKHTEMFYHVQSIPLTFRVFSVFRGYQLPLLPTSFQRPAKWRNLREIWASPDNRYYFHFKFPILIKC